MSDATVTVSIVSHGQGALVARLLEDLAEHSGSSIARILFTRNLPEPLPTLPASLAARVTVIDNPGPRGFGANHNAAFARSDSRYFAILNPDLRLPTDPLLPLAATLARGTASAARLALVAPRIVDDAGRPEDAARTLITPWRLLQRRLLRSSHRPADRPDWLAGMFMLVRSDAFREVGGFDERFFMYCEDSDLCARLRLHGWDFRVVDGVAVVHDARRASHGSFRHLRWHLSSLVKLWLSPAFWRYRRMLRATPR